MKTRDYSIFRNINGNRKVSPRHVERLTAAIERKNLLKYYPVLVNEDMEVIDGQHRLVAAAKLDYEIHYEKIKGLVLEDVMSINTHSKSWSLSDFVDAYIRLGNKNYIELREFGEKHHITLTTSAGLLTGVTSYKGGGGVSTKLRDGNFLISHRIFAEEVAEWLNTINAQCDFDALLDRPFIATLASLRDNDNFDFERLLAKLRVSGKKIEKRADKRYYLIHIEEIYNYNMSTNKTELYASTQAA